jgi:thiol-disulfide isomerase/thioredoxin
MFERLLIVCLLGFISMSLFLIWRQWQMRQLNGMGPAVLSSPTVLYFRSDTCPTCPAQARYLEQVKSVWNGRFAVHTINADLEPEQTARYRVLSLPTTILLDETGQVKHINYGLTNSQKLVKQLTNL